MKSPEVLVLHHSATFNRALLKMNSEMARSLRGLLNLCSLLL